MRLREQLRQLRLRVGRCSGFGLRLGTFRLRLERQSLDNRMTGHELETDGRIDGPTLGGICERCRRLARQVALIAAFALHGLLEDGA